VLSLKGPGLIWQYASAVRETPRPNAWRSQHHGRNVEAGVITASQIAAITHTLDYLITLWDFFHAIQPLNQARRWFRACLHPGAQVGGDRAGHNQCKQFGMVS
jgi:hypothetical protein